MRIVCISDTHGLHREAPPVPHGDVLVHAGDLTNNGALREVAAFNDWLGELPHRHKVVIAGNHDFCFEHQRGQAVVLLTNAVYLEDSAHVIDGVRFHGSPSTPWFWNWAFNFPERELGSGITAKRVWSAVPADTHVLITHGPPRGALDLVPGPSPRNVGCPFLSERIHQLDRLRLHVFGHIHQGYGRLDAGAKTFINASTCDKNYEPVNAALVFDLEPPSAHRASPTVVSPGDAD